MPATSHQPPVAIQLCEFSSGAVESFFVAEKIKELHEAGTPFNEIAVIYRENKDALDLIDTLAQTEIPFRVEGGEDVLRDQEVRKLLNLFKVINNPYQDLLLYEILHYPFFQINTLDLYKIGYTAGRANRKIFAVISTLPSVIPACPESDKANNQTEKLLDSRQSENDNFLLDNPQALQKVVALILKWSQDAANKSLVEFFEIVLNESGLLNYLMRLENQAETLNRFNSLFDTVKNLNRNNRFLNLDIFLKQITTMEEYRLKLEEEKIQTANEAVTLTTAHKAKGTEFEVVFITKLFDGKWGNKREHSLIKLPPTIFQEVQQEIDSNEEERRLFFVALTRAKKAVYLCHSQTYSQNGKQNKTTVPALFLGEIDPTLITLLESKSYEDATLPRLIQNLKVPANSYSIAETDFLREILKEFRLSVTALNNYLECPCKFKLQNLLRIPRAKTKSLCLGSAVHFALEETNLEFLKTNQFPTVDFMLKSFEKGLKKEILTQEDFLDSLTKGEELVKKFYAQYKAHWIKPLKVEYNFGRHSVYLGEIPLTGKLDKVELIDSQINTVNVVDYKTGKFKTRNEILGKTQNSNGDLSRQLVFYKLLAEKDPLFGYQITEGELNFIEPGEKDNFHQEKFELTSQSVLELEKLIQDAWQKILNLEFDCTEDKSCCEKCDFQGICMKRNF